MAEWRVVRVIRTVEVVDDRTYPNSDQAAAAAFGYRTQSPGESFEIEKVEDG